MYNVQQYSLLLVLVFSPWSNNQQSFHNCLGLLSNLKLRRLKCLAMHLQVSLSVCTRVKNCYSERIMYSELLGAKNWAIWYFICYFRYVPFCIIGVLILMKTMIPNICYILLPTTPLFYVLENNTIELQHQDSKTNDKTTAANHHLEQSGNKLNTIEVILIILILSSWSNLMTKFKHSRWLTCSCTLRPNKLHHCCSL